MELSEKLKKHVQGQSNIEIEEQRVTEVVEESNCISRVNLDKGSSYGSKTLIIASGAHRGEMGREVH
jgi:thioredoxin reductase